jgi:hypothetical protein
MFAQQPAMAGELYTMRVEAARELFYHPVEIRDDA